MKKGGDEVTDEFNALAALISWGELDKDDFKLNLFPEAVSVDPSTGGVQVATH